METSSGNVFQNKTLAFRLKFPVNEQTFCTYGRVQSLQCSWVCLPYGTLCYTSHCKGLLHAVCQRRPLYRTWRERILKYSHSVGWKQEIHRQHVQLEIPVSYKSYAWSSHVKMVTKTEYGHITIFCMWHISAERILDSINLILNFISSPNEVK